METPTLAQTMLAAARDAAFARLNPVETETATEDPALAEIARQLQTGDFGCRRQDVTNLILSVLAFTQGAPVTLPGVATKDSDLVGALLFETSEDKTFLVHQHDSDGQVFGHAADGTYFNPYPRDFRDATKEEAEAFFEAAAGEGFWATRQGLRSLVDAVGTDNDA